MRREALAALLRARQVAVNEAERALAVATQDEEATRKTAKDRDAHILSESDIAADLTTGDGAVEAFAAWLPGALKESQAAWSAHERANARVNVARAELTLAQSAAEAASKFLQRQAAKERETQIKKAQSALDEFASRSPFGKPGR